MSIYDSTPDAGAATGDGGGGGGDITVPEWTPDAKTLSAPSEPKKPMSPEEKKKVMMIGGGCVPAASEFWPLLRARSGVAPLVLVICSVLCSRGSRDFLPTIYRIVAGGLYAGIVAWLKSAHVLPHALRLPFLWTQDHRPHPPGRRH